MNDIFISYARSTEGQAKQIAEAEAEARLAAAKPAEEAKA